MTIRVLVFSSWGIRDGISRGATLPLLDAMALNTQIEKIVLTTIESDDCIALPASSEKVVHIPFRSHLSSVANKIHNFIRLPPFLARLMRKNAIDLLWCKGAPAGAVGSLVNLMTGVPYVVDSFEPHGQYMLDSGTWSRLDLKFLTQSILEKLVVRTAMALLPVSRHYLESLVRHGVERDRLFMVPCVVNANQFRYDAHQRDAVRRQLNISEKSVVGVYVGKYGGLYYDLESFELYRELFAFFGPEFHLIIVTEVEADIVISKLRVFDLPAERVVVIRALHEEVPGYLSAADFAISTVKSVQAMKYCSPIKHGEYWAADLPILSTLAAGDDADIMEREGGGVIVRLRDGSMENHLLELQGMMDFRGTGRFYRLALTHRSMNMLSDGIQFVLSRLVTKGTAGD